MLESRICVTWLLEFHTDVLGASHAASFSVGESKHNIKNRIWKISCACQTVCGSGSLRPNSGRSHKALPCWHVAKRPSKEVDMIVLCLKIAKVFFFSPNVAMPIFFFFKHEVRIITSGKAALSFSGAKKGIFSVEGGGEWKGKWAWFIVWYEVMVSQSGDQQP